MNNTLIFFTNFGMNGYEYSFYDLFQETKTLITCFLTSFTIGILIYCREPTEVPPGRDGRGEDEQEHEVETATSKVNREWSDGARWIKGKCMLPVSPHLLLPQRTQSESHLFSHFYQPRRTWKQ